MERAAVPSGTTLTLYLHAVFDTDIVVDTFRLTPQEFRQHASQTRAHLQRSYAQAKWSEEGALAVHSDDDLSDFVPALNLSYLVATCPDLLAHPSLTVTLPDGTLCETRFALPVIYFHAFSTGIISLKISTTWTRPWASADVRMLEERLLAELDALVAAGLVDVIAAFGAAVKATNVPLYQTPLNTRLPADSQRNVLYWSHRVFAAQPQSPQDIPVVAEQLVPLMRPIDNRGVNNMALKPDRYIYFGSGCSMICCPSEVQDDILYPYVRIIEIRNYLWKTLYDLDRGLRTAIALGRNMRTPRQARRLVRDLRELDFRVRGVLEELDAHKLTFDNEKIWLMRQLDENWLTADLVRSVQARLDSFGSFYAYTEDMMTRRQEERLRFVLNLIGIFATAGAIAQIISYFDPLNQLQILTRAALFSATLLMTLLIFSFALLIARQVRKRD